jgi:hypothetical protein
LGNLTQIGEHLGRNKLESGIATRHRAVLAVVTALGLLGVASLATAPLASMLPEDVEIPTLVLLIQPAILVCVFSVLGWWASAKVGLSAPVIEGLIGHGDAVAPFLRALLPSALVAFATAVVLGAYSVFTVGMIPIVEAQPSLPLAAKLLYGGLSEEVIARWGILSVLMVLALRLGFGYVAAFWIANLIAAFLFAIGHFGMVFALVDEPSVQLLAAVIVGNSLPAIAFGWLYRAYGLESAMMAHAGGHVLFILGAGIAGLPS